MEELRCIMEKFVASDWDLIAVPAQQWLDGKADKNERRFSSRLYCYAGNSGGRLRP